MLRPVALLCLLATSALAEPRTITFAPSDADFANPERGWWLFAADDFAKATEDDIAATAAEGITVAYGIVRLDDYRDGPLPEQLLADLESRFALARKHGLKIILRFAYNYPGSSFDYENAKDAPLPVVLDHIDQLAPVIQANADAIVAMQAGFIGAWGEGHTSSNGLDTPEAKAAIRDALYAAVPDTIPLQWRYPPDILSWTGDTRMGFHNDCFLSSPTDVGTYDEDEGIRQSQRTAMAALTDRTYFSGETCDADADATRTDCASILNEGAEFHLSALNRSYYEAFHEAWKAEGCYPEVTRKLGYRLRLVEAEVDGDLFRLVIANDGWARPVHPRVIWLISYAGEKQLGAVELTGKLAELGAGQEKTFYAALPAPAEADRLCLTAPDTNPRLATDPRYAIRFANADTEGQAWDPALAAFCFDLE
ncbi:DUF4874 domain-containing protein [Tabrizicola sp.]|uniref:DUF4874 domain-containing protein n=1 Tax=Tabrizicola sp. TaxID=2005166 RepID=UPI003F31DC59